MNKMKLYIDSHRFFVNESPSYFAPLTWEYYVYYPVAYYKFMRLMLTQPPMHDPL